MDFSVISRYGILAQIGGASGVLGGGWRTRPVTSTGPGGRVVADVVQLSGAAQVLLGSKAAPYGVNGAHDSLLSSATSVFTARPSINGAGLDFSGENLSGLDLRNGLFVGANFSDAKLIGSDLRWADLRRANLAGADLFSADLRGADLTGALGLTQRMVSGAVVDASTALPAYAPEPEPEDTTTAFANDPGAYQYSYGFDFSGADLSFADFRNADLRQASFAGANLVGADFSYALVDGADFTDADLTGANLTNALGLTEDLLANAIYDATTLLPKNLMHLNVVWDLNPTGSSRWEW